MEYSKHTWENGEVITADKMNNIEEGVNNLNSNFSINITSLFTLNTTYFNTNNLSVYKFGNMIAIIGIIITIDNVPNGTNLFTVSGINLKPDYRAIVNNTKSSYTPIELQTKTNEIFITSYNLPVNGESIILNFLIPID